MAVIMTPKPAWQRYRLPILLAILAICLYASSILWIIFGRGGAA